MKRSKRRVAAVIDGAVAIVMAVANSIDPGPLATFIAPQYQSMVFLVMFGIALWLLHADNKQEIARLSERRASIRARVVDHFVVEIKNVGPLEAQRVRILPVMHGDFPWQLEFAIVGSLVATDPAARPQTRITARDALSCERCSGKPRAIEDFVRDVQRHYLHTLERSEGTQALTPVELDYVVGAMAKMTAITVPLTVAYLDSLGRQTEAEHNLHLESNDDRVAAEAIFDRETVR